MALTNRNEIRAEISALFDDITELQENIGYPPLKIEGKSPVLSIHGDGTIPKMLGKSSNEFDHYFTVTIYVNREAHGASDAEDLLDTIFTEVLQRIRNTPTGTTYMVIVADVSRSVPQFVTIDGKPYRVEEIGVAARSNVNG